MRVVLVAMLVIWALNLCLGKKLSSGAKAPLRPHLYAGAEAPASYRKCPGVLGANGGIVEAGGDGVCGGDLAVAILQNVRVCALQHAGTRAGITLRGGEARSVLA